MLWKELKRISSLTETEIEKTINNDSSIEGFSIEGIRVDIKDENNIENMFKNKKGDIIYNKSDLK